MDSAGWWLIPPLQRTNSIPTSVKRAIAIASWPAPLGSSRTPSPSASTASPRRRMSRGLHRHAPVSWVVTRSNNTPRRASIPSNASSMPRSAARRQASLSPRTSTVNSTTPGITLTAPGMVRSTPTVPTAPGTSRQVRSIAATASAAAASASRRRRMGTVPAWPARPITSTRSRVAPAMDVTTPTGRPSASSTGPCSMCTST